MSKYLGTSLSVEDMQREEMERLAKEHGIDLENPGMDVTGADGEEEDGMQYMTSSKANVDELTALAEKMTIDKKHKKKA